eukprot:g80845.t1
METLLGGENVGATGWSTRLEKNFLNMVDHVCSLGEVKFFSAQTKRRTRRCVVKMLAQLSRFKESRKEVSSRMLVLD